MKASASSYMLCLATKQYVDSTKMQVDFQSILQLQHIFPPLECGDSTSSVTWSRKFLTCYFLGNVSYFTLACPLCFGQKNQNKSLRFAAYSPPPPIHSVHSGKFTAQSRTHPMPHPQQTLLINLCSLSHRASMEP